MLTPISHTLSALDFGLSPRHCRGVHTGQIGALHQLYSHHVGHTRFELNLLCQRQLHHRYGCACACEGPGRMLRGPGCPSSPSSLPGLEAARDLEAKEVTPRTALLTWAEPQDPPTGYLLSFNSPGGETQVPSTAPTGWPSFLLPGGSASVLTGPLLCPPGNPAPWKHHLLSAPGSLSLHPL